MNKILSAWLQRWQGLAPREQWLSYAVGLGLLVMLYMLLLADPLSQRIATQDSQRRLAEARQLEASNMQLEIQAKLAADPNLSYRQALRAAEAARDRTLQRIDEETSTLVSPAKMKALLQDLLRTQPKLKLLELESFSAPLTVPGTETSEQGENPAFTFYRHGLRLTLQGGYFELLSYLQAIQASGWRLHWDRLDYQVGEDGYSQAQIMLELHTLSRHAGWVGV